MESEFTNLGMMGLSVVLDLTVTVLIVKRLCKSKLICSFNKSSLILFNVLILIFCTILIRLDISMGTGVGLFAVLAMFRFRSKVLKTQEMFYLLMLIGIAFVHAAFPDVLSIIEVLFIDMGLLVMSFVLAKSDNPTNKFKISLDDIDLIKPSNEAKFRSMLEKEFGYTFKNIEVLNVNMKRGRVELMVETDEPIDNAVPEADEVNVNSLEVTHVKSMPLAIN